MSNTRSIHLLKKLRVLKVSITLFALFVASCAFSQKLDSVAISKQLLPGWNLVNYPHTDTLPINSALSSAWNKLLAVKDMDSFYSRGKDQNLGQLTTLTPGNAYFVDVSDSCSITWYAPVVNNCCKVSVPNAFTPGSDKVELASFKIKVDSCCAFVNFSINIYDRWGSLLFTGNSPGDTWDGNNNGTEYKSDTYVYIVEYQTWVEKKKITGNVMLIR